MIDILKVVVTVGVILLIFAAWMVAVLSAANFVHGWLQVQLYHHYDNQMQERYGISLEQAIERNKDLTPSSRPKRIDDRPGHGFVPGHGDAPTTPPKAP